MIGQVLEESELEFRTLGISGPKVSRLGLGCNNFGGRLDFEGSSKVVHKALDLGITFFDTADSYGINGGSEQTLGKILGARRNDIVLATKFGWQLDKEGKLKGASRDYIMSAVEASLKRLQTDWIDLYQLHVPDPVTPIEETLRALDDLVKQGKVRHIGCSNLSGQQIDAAQQTSKSFGLEAFISTQNQYSLLMRGIERELVQAIERHQLGFIPFSPLAAGMLTGKYRANAPLPGNSRIASSPKHKDQYVNDATWRIIEGLIAFAERRGHTLLELAMGWLMARPFVTTVIAGAMTPEQLEQNAGSIGWKLTAEEVAETDRIASRRSP